MLNRAWFWAQTTWWLAPICLLGVLVLDLALMRPASYLVIGIIDEPAHLLTTLIGLLAVAAATDRDLPAPFVISALLAGNLIDLDHLPLTLGDDVLTAGTPRPYSHSLTTVIVLLIVAAATRGSARASLGGAALGVTLHLLRDVGTAPVSLFWPISPDGIRVPEAFYAAALAIMTAIDVRFARSPVSPGSGRRSGR